MKKITKFGLLLFIIVVGLSFTVNAQSRKRKKAEEDTKSWRYELECVGTGVKGTYLVKVWTYSKNPKVAIEQAKKNAVHGVIFKGFGGGVKRCKPQPALSRNPNLEFEKREFFDDFFADGGKYMKYVNMSTDGSIGAGDRLKVGKEYKVGIVVSINKDALRKDLEDAGIIEGLASGF